LAACGLIAVATGCNTIAAANGAASNEEFVQEIAARLKTTSSMAYTAVYALGAGGTATVAQLPATGQAAYTYPTGMTLVTSGKATVCTRAAGRKAICGDRPSVLATSADLARGGLVRVDSVVALLNASALNRNSVVSEHDTTIAGTSATCVTVNGGASATGGYEACVTADGLLGSFSGAVNSVPVAIEMINFTKSVSSDEFDLPTTTQPTSTQPAATNR
jgi:outer membrane lipoprotein-sorting protein